LMIQNRIGRSTIYYCRIILAFNAMSSVPLHISSISIYEP
jgi:hypothetical protein